MAKEYQPNCSFNLQEETLNNLRILSRLSGKSINRLANEVLKEFVAKFSAEIAEFENFARTAARKVQGKICGYDVTKIKLKKLHTNAGELIAANLDDNIVATAEINEVDGKNAIEFCEKIFKTIGSNSYEITRTDNSITVTTGEKKLSQEFEDAGTAEKVEALIDDVIGQVTKQATAGEN